MDNAKRLIETIQTPPEIKKAQIFCKEEEMWEAGLSKPYKDMILSEVVEYLETLQTKEEKKKFLTAVYWSGFQACLEHEDDCTGF